MDITQTLKSKFGVDILAVQETADDIPTLWTTTGRVKDVLRYLKLESKQPYPMLYDLTAIDERERKHRHGQPASDFTIVYHLASFEWNADLRLKVPLTANKPSLPSISGLWANANWYEREV